MDLRYLKKLLRDYSKGFLISSFLLVAAFLGVLSLKVEAADVRAKSSTVSAAQQSASSSTDIDPADIVHPNEDLDEDQLDKVHEGSSHEDLDKTSSTEKISAEPITGSSDDALTELYSGDNPKQTVACAISAANFFGHQQQSMIGAFQSKIQQLIGVCNSPSASSQQVGKKGEALSSGTVVNLPLSDPLSGVKSVWYFDGQGSVASAFVFPRDKEFDMGSLGSHFGALDKLFYIRNLTVGIANIQTTNSVFLKAVNDVVYPAGNTITPIAQLPAGGFIEADLGIRNNQFGLEDLFESIQLKNPRVRIVIPLGATELRECRFFLVNRDKKPVTMQMSSLLQKMKIDLPQGSITDDIRSMTLTTIDTDFSIVESGAMRCRFLGDVTFHNKSARFLLSIEIKDNKFYRFAFALKPMNVQTFKFESIADKFSFIDKQFSLDDIAFVISNGKIDDPVFLEFAAASPKDIDILKSGGFIQKDSSSGGAKPSDEPTLTLDDLLGDDAQGTSDPGKSSANHSPDSSASASAPTASAPVAPAVDPMQNAQTKSAFCGGRGAAGSQDASADQNAAKTLLANKMAELKELAAGLSIIADIGGAPGSFVDKTLQGFGLCEIRLIVTIPKEINLRNISKAELKKIKLQAVPLQQHATGLCLIEGFKPLLSEIGLNSVGEWLDKNIGQTCFAPTATQAAAASADSSANLTLDDLLADDASATPAAAPTGTGNAAPSTPDTGSSDAPADTSDAATSADTSDAAQSYVDSSSSGAELASALDAPAANVATPTAAAPANQPSSSGGATPASQPTGGQPASGGKSPGKGSSFGAVSSFGFGLDNDFNPLVFVSGPLTKGGKRAMIKLKYGSPSTNPNAVAEAAKPDAKDAAHGATSSADHKTTADDQKHGKQDHATTDKADAKTKPESDKDATPDAKSSTSNKFFTIAWEGIAGSGFKLGDLDRNLAWFDSIATFSELCIIASNDAYTSAFDIEDNKIKSTAPGAILGLKGGLTIIAEVQLQFGPLKDFVADLGLGDLIFQLNTPFKPKSMKDVSAVFKSTKKGKGLCLGQLIKDKSVLDSGIGSFFKKTCAEIDSFNIVLDANNELVANITADVVIDGVKSQISYSKTINKAPKGTGAAASAEPVKVQPDAGDSKALSNVADSAASKKAFGSVLSIRPQFDGKPLELAKLDSSLSFLDGLFEFDRFEIIYSTIPVLDQTLFVDFLGDKYKDKITSLPAGLSVLIGAKPEGVIGKYLGTLGFSDFSLFVVRPAGSKGTKDMIVRLLPIGSLKSNLCFSDVLSPILDADGLSDELRPIKNYLAKVCPVIDLIVADPVKGTQFGITSDPSRPKADAMIKTALVTGKKRLITAGVRLGRSQTLSDLLSFSRDAQSKVREIEKYISLGDLTFIYSNDDVDPAQVVSLFDPASYDLINSPLGTAGAAGATTPGQQPQPNQPATTGQSALVYGSGLVNPVVKTDDKTKTGGAKTADKSQSHPEESHQKDAKDAGSATKAGNDKAPGAVESTETIAAIKPGFTIMAELEIGKDSELGKLMDMIGFKESHLVVTIPPKMKSAKDISVSLKPISSQTNDTFCLDKLFAEIPGGREFFDKLGFSKLCITKDNLEILPSAEGIAIEFDGSVDIGSDHLDITVIGMKPAGKPAVFSAALKTQSDLSFSRISSSLGKFLDVAEFKHPVIMFSNITKEEAEDQTSKSHLLYTQTSLGQRMPNALQPGISISANAHFISDIKHGKFMGYPFDLFNINDVDVSLLIPEDIANFNGYSIVATKQVNQQAGNIELKAFNFILQAGEPPKLELRLDSVVTMPWKPHEKFELILEVDFNETDWSLLGELKCAKGCPSLSLPGFPLKLFATETIPLSIKYDFEAVEPSGIGGTGNLKVGHDDITFAYDVDLADPENSAVQATISKLCWTDLMSMALMFAGDVGIGDIKIPGIICLENGKFSVAMNDVTIAGVTIKQGLDIEGDLMLEPFHVGGHILIKVVPPGFATVVNRTVGITAEASLDRINIEEGGFSILKITDAEDDKKGASLKLDLNGQKQEISISGEISVANGLIKDVTDIKISPQGFFANLDTKLAGLDFDIKINAPTDALIHGRFKDWSLHAEMKNDLSKQVEEVLQDATREVIKGMDIMSSGVIKLCDELFFFIKDDPFFFDCKGCVGGAFNIGESIIKSVVDSLQVSIDDISLDSNLGEIMKGELPKFAITFTMFGVQQTLDFQLDLADPMKTIKELLKDALKLVLLPEKIIEKLGTDFIKNIKVDCSSRMHINKSEVDVKIHLDGNDLSGSYVEGKAPKLSLIDIFNMAAAIIDNVLKQTGATDKKVLPTNLPANFLPIEFDDVDLKFGGQGIIIKGKMNLLGLEAFDVDGTVDKTGLRFEADVPKINLGPLSISNPADKNLGPQLKIVITKDEQYAKLNGEMSFAGIINESVEIDLQTKNPVIEVDGGFLGVKTHFKCEGIDFKTGNIDGAALNIHFDDKVLLGYIKEGVDDVKAVIDYPLDKARSGMQDVINKCEELPKALACLACPVLKFGEGIITAVEGLANGVLDELTKFNIQSVDFNGSLTAFKAKNGTLSVPEIKIVYQMGGPSPLTIDIKDFDFSSFGAFMKNTLGKIFNPEKVAESIADAAKDIFTGKLLKDAGEFILDALKEMGTCVGDLVMEGVHEVEKIGKDIADGFDEIGHDLEGGIEGALKATEAAIKTAEHAIEDAVKFVEKIAVEVEKALEVAAEAIKDAIVTAAKAIAHAAEVVGHAIEEAGKAVAHALEKAADWVAGAAKTVWSGVKSFFSKW